MKVLPRIQIVLIVIVVIFAVELQADVSDISQKEIEDFNNKPQLKEHAKSEKQKSFNFTFYAKIVDQHGDIVPDAEVVFNRGFFNPLALYFNGNERFVSSSDKNGLLKIEKYGCILSIEDVKKDGYEFMRFKASAGKVYTPEKSFAVSQKNGKNIFPHSKSEDPAVIVMRKRGRREYLYKDDFSFRCNAGEIKSQQLRVLDRWIDSYGFEHQAVSEEKNKHYNLRKMMLDRGISVDRLPGNFKDEVDMEYDIRVTYSYPSDGNTWEIVFDFIGDDGGIILGDDLLYEAPIAGYQKQVKIVGNKGEVRGFQKSFLYVKSDGGASYSRISFDFRDSLGHISGRGEIFTNPGGSRNLEYDGEFVIGETAKRRLTAGRFLKIKKEAMAKYHEDLKKDKKTPLPDMEKLADDFREMIRQERKAAKDKNNI